MGSIGQPLLMAQESPKVEAAGSGGTATSYRAKRASSAWAPVAFAILMLGLVVVLGFIYCTEGTNSQLLMVYNAGADASLALKATLLDTAVLWTGSSLTAQQALLSVVPTAAALVVVTPGPSKPSRRTPDQAVLTCSPDISLPCDRLNSAATVMEAALGRQLFPLTITAADMSAQRSTQTGMVRPYVVWEVGSGTVLVDKWLVERVWTQPKVQRMSELLAEHLFKALAQTLTLVASVSASSLQLNSLMGPALSAAVAAAFAAAPPLWFCIVCPAVLGLIAPLLINIALNQLAGYLCTHMQLPDDQCFDLLLGALGLGFVLSLASAIPIFYVCKLQECAHRDQGGVQPQQGKPAKMIARLRRAVA